MASLNKARLNPEMEEHAQGLTALNGMGRVTASTVDLHDVLNLITGKAIELLQAGAGSFAWTEYLLERKHRADRFGSLCPDCSYGSRKWVSSCSNNSAASTSLSSGLSGPEKNR